MSFLNRDSSNVTHHCPTVLAIVIVAGALFAAAPASAQTAPVAVDDSYPIATGSDLYIETPGVLTNDTDAELDPLTAVLVTPPALGTVRLREDGGFIYYPGGLFAGLDSFTYTAFDGALSSNVATVTITEAYPANTVNQSTCVNESNGLDNVCVANDLTFVELGLGVQSDGCVNPADRLIILMRGVLANTTSQARYDAGMWFPRESTTRNPDFDLGLSPWEFLIDPEGDGAYTGHCGSLGFMNPEPWISGDHTTPTELCWFDTPTSGDLDLAGNFWGLEFGHGPWVSDDGKTDYDSCGDLFDDGHNPGCDQDVDSDWDDSVIIFDSLMTLDCNDADWSTGSEVKDGFVSTPVCLTWGNQSTQVDDTLLEDPIYGGNDKCDVQSELKPGTKSKCRCEQYQLTNIPAPDLSLLCEMPAGVFEMRPGGFVQVSVTYTNSCTCTEDPATEARFKCCTASYVQFPILYNSTDGHITDISADNGTWVDDGAGTLTWTPATAPLAAGVIPQNQSATITFFYHDDSGTASGLTDIVDVTSTWSDANDILNGVFTFFPKDQATLDTPCEIIFNPTWATISNVKAEVRDSRTVVSWESSAEVGSVGYNVFRADSKGGRWTQVNRQLLPALGDGPGGHYQFVDDSAPIEGTVSYKVVEVDGWGGAREAQPITVELGEVEGDGPDSQFVTEHRRPSTRMMAAIEKSARRAPQGIQTSKIRRTSGDSRIKPGRPAYLKIGISETGMHRLSAFDIATALGESVAKIEDRIAKQQLALTAGGEPVAWRGEPDDTGIVFFGQAPDSMYSAEKAYMLSKGDGLGIERASGDAPQAAGEGGAFPEEVVREENILMRPFNVIEDGKDFWFWSGALADQPGYEEKDFEVELEDVAEVDASARLRVSFVGFGFSFKAGGSVMVNGHHVGDFSGPIFSHQTAEFEFDHGFLKNGANTIRLIGEESGFLIDRFDIGYQRQLHTSTNELMVRTADDAVVSITGFTTAAVEVYDVSDPLRPVLLPVGTTSTLDGSSIVASFTPTSTEGRYLVLGGDAVRQPSSITGRTKSELRNNLLGADYVIITTAKLANTAERLARYRQGDGLEAMVVDVEDIFDDFAFGARHPDAITAFLAFAIDRWMIQPKYVLLAGRGNYDYRDIQGYGGNLIPPVLAATPRGLIPSDNKLADVDGDGLPDVAIGRLPVLSAAELSSVIDKIITYEGEPAVPWRSRVVLVADNPDDAGNFHDSSGRLAGALAGGRLVQEYYLSEPYTSDQIHDYLMGSLNGGVGVLNWIGHAGFDSLAEERVLDISDLTDLGQTNQPSMVLGLTCLINNHGLPYFASLGEELVLKADGGAIGVWAASGLSLNDQAEQLGKSFMAALDSSEQLRLGDIIQKAVGEFSESGADIQAVDGYVLFADPALILK